MPTLSQRLGSFPKQEKIESKISQKTSFFLVSATLSVSLTLPMTFTTTTGFTTVISINLAPHQWQSSHRDLSRSFLSHWPNILSMSETPKPNNFLFPTLPLSSCSGRIIKWSLGQAKTSPAPF